MRLVLLSHFLCVTISSEAEVERLSAIPVKSGCHSNHPVPCVNQADSAVRIRCGSPQWLLDYKQ
jgi:hypothetical protein